METKTYLYEDPTGGGDDARLVLPVSWVPPDSITVTMKNGTREYMDLLGTDEED